MLRLLYCAILALALALVACSSPTPTPAPTATPVPTPTAPPPTAMPTATPPPTATPIPASAPTAVPEPTAPPAMAAPAGVLAPIDPSDPQAFLAALPATEQACLAANSDPRRVITLAGLPGAAITSPQEVADALDCLGDDTLLRIFVSGMLAGIGAISPESSDCLRAGFANYDLRSAMLPGADQGAAGDMAAFFQTLSCLNEAEWQAAAPVLELNPGDRETLQCVIDTLGGSAELAAALEPDAAGRPAGAYLTAAAQCGMNLTPESPESPAAGTIAPIDPNNPQAFLTTLPASEQTCLAANSDPLRVITLAGMPGAPIAAPQEAAALIDCLGDDTLMRVFLSGMLTGVGPLSQETSDCVRAGFANFDLRSVLLAGAAESNPGAAMAGSMAAMFLSLSCLNEAEWQAAAPALELNPDDRAPLLCMRETLGGAAELAAALYPDADGLPSPAYLDAAAQCGAAPG